VEGEQAQGRSGGAGGTGHQYQAGVSEKEGRGDHFNTLHTNTICKYHKYNFQVVLGLAEQGINSALFWENPDKADYISLVPTSAHSGDGMGNLMGQLVEMSQNQVTSSEIIIFLITIHFTIIFLSII
jgi:translation initiation factor IF-2